MIKASFAAIKQLQSGLAMERYGAAQKLEAMCALAEAYQVGYDDVVEVLAEKFERVGGVGTPKVSEFVTMELAALLGCSVADATGKLADALNLKHRHPALFAAVMELELDQWRALKAARMCAELSPETAARVTDRWLPRQEALPTGRALSVLTKLIIEADAELAARKERAAREQRGVHVWGLDHGAMNLTGRLDVLDARYLDAAVNRIAGILAADQPDATKDVLRAKALGVLANPAYALALQQRDLQQSLLEPPAPSDDVVPGANVATQSEDDGQRHDPHCLGMVCGTITTPLARLRPTLELAVHLHTDAVGHLTGVARIEKAGHITTGLLAALLGDVEVTVQPVIDLPEMPLEDQYRPSARMRRAVELAMAHEAFPFSGRASRRLDVDHTSSYIPRAEGQTRIGNLGPLSRKAHRLKTAGIWGLRQPVPGRFEWESPLGMEYVVCPEGSILVA